MNSVLELVCVVQQVQTCRHEIGTCTNTHTNQLMTLFMIAINLIGKLKY